MTKQELIAYIITLVDFCIGDSNTYLWAKCEKNFKDASHVGRGNFTILLASYSVIDLLAYVNGFLNKESTYNQEDINALKGNINYRLPKIGEIKPSITDLVKKLLEETSSITGIESNKIDILWKIRNKLTHEFNPKFMAAGSYDLMPDQNYNELVQKIDNFPIFTKGNNGQDCIDVHAFNHKIRKIADHVKSKIEDADEEIIEKISFWLINS